MKTEISKDQLIKLIEELSGRAVNTAADKQDMSIPVGISNRHIHLCQSDIDQLFGIGYELTVQKWLSQPGQFAAKEIVTLVGTKGSINKVRVLGPARSKSQVEISKTDSLKLGVVAPISESGKLDQAGAITVVGPKGMLELKQNVIIAKRHIHMHPNDAAKHGVIDGELVAIKTDGDRGLIFNKTMIRVDENFKLECHLDTDEANAAGLTNRSTVEIVKQEIG